MEWSPTAKIVAAATALLGAGYLIFRKPKPPKPPKPGVDVPVPPPEVPEGVLVPDVLVPEPPPEEVPGEPVPEPIPLPPKVPKPTIPPMGGLAPSASPRIPPPNWQHYFNEHVEAALAEGRALDEIQTGYDLKLYVAARLFPSATWPMPPSPPTWQETVWQTILTILHRRARVQDWPFHGTRETIDAAITFWVSAEKNLQACRGTGVASVVELTRCAAERTFPDVSWPATPSSRAWEREAWARFQALAQPEPTIPSPEGLSPGEVYDWEGIYEANVIDAIAAGRDDLEVRTSQEMQAFVCAYIFPDEAWPPPADAAPWRMTVWNTTHAVLADLAEADEWPGAGEKTVRDHAITFWISGAWHVGGCRAGMALPGRDRELFDSVVQCAASYTFPRHNWPPKESGEPLWKYKAWREFESLVW